MGCPWMVSTERSSTRRYKPKANYLQPTRYLKTLRNILYYAIEHPPLSHGHRAIPPPCYHRDNFRRRPSCIHYRCTRTAEEAFALMAGPVRRRNFRPRAEIRCRKTEQMAV